MVSSTPGRGLIPGEGQFPMHRGHLLGQVVGSEQASLEDLGGLQVESVEAASERGFIVELNAIPEAGTDPKQSAHCYRQACLLAASISDPSA